MGQENANNPPPPPPPTVYQQWAARFRDTAGSGLAFALIPLLLLGYFGWYYYGAQHLDKTLYALKIENIELTPKPPWIRSDIKAQIYRENGLSQVSLLEPQATATIAHAFDSHVWIKNTNRVRKLSGGKVVVDVTYRRPAAMIYYEPLIKPPVTATPKGLCYPVDEEGVVLPGDEFAEKVHDYFMIFAPNAAPAGKRMAFGDERIAAALALCRLLEPQRVPLKLDCIHVEPDSIDQQLGGFNSWIMHVVTEDKREIIWGHAPGKESKDELSIEEKLVTLRAWLQTPPSATNIAVLDLRQRRVLGPRLITVPGT